MLDCLDEGATNAVDVGVAERVLDAGEALAQRVVAGRCIDPAREVMVRSKVFDDVVGALTEDVVELRLVATCPVGRPPRVRKSKCSAVSRGHAPRAEPGGSGMAQNRQINGTSPTAITNHHASNGTPSFP